MHTKLTGNRRAVTADPARGHDVDPEQLAPGPAALAIAPGFTRGLDALLGLTPRAAGDDPFALPTPEAAKRKAKEEEDEDDEDDEDEDEEDDEFDDPDEEDDDYDDDDEEFDEDDE